MPTATQHADDESTDRRWSASGLAALTGPPDAPPLGEPVGFLRRLDALTARIASASAALGRTVEVDGPTELVRRARALGLRRRGQVSCGGATQLVRAADGWFAVSLARPDDVDLLPAWLATQPGRYGTDAWTDAWADVHAGAAERTVDDVVSAGALLGLPIAALPTRAIGTTLTTVPSANPGDRFADSGASAPARPLRVVDLSSMWAGPLCGAVLAATGADVTKVELAGRPDGARGGPPSLFDRLNAAKHHLELDVRTTPGLRRLEEMLRSADVVIESSRPRALRQLGIDADALVRDADHTSVWVSITGHGRTGDAANRVAFGDDAAVGGGLVAWSGDVPCFCADAVADPLTGLTAAAAAMEAIAPGGAGTTAAPALLDVAMVKVAAHFAGAAG